MTNKSNLDVAYEAAKGLTEPITFKELWDEVSKIQEFTQEEKDAKMGKFYTNLLLDGRFVNLGDNVWDLRERNTFDKVHIDMTDCYSEEEEEDLDPEEESENEEAEKALGEKEIDDEQESKYEPEESI